MTLATTWAQTWCVPRAPSDRRPQRRRSAALPVAAAAGGHVPVLLPELLAALRPVAGEAAVDGTLGAGGVTRALCDHVLPGGRVLALDRDPAAISRAREGLAAYGPAVVLEHASFGDLEAVAQRHDLRPDIITFDLGVSSLQLGDPARGFSLRQPGPLDMRFDPAGGAVSAADLVNTLEQGELARLIRTYGGERFAGSIAARIVRRRASAPLTSTSELAACCESAIPRRFWPRHIHPATRTFQALRIVVNDELGELERGLAAAIRILRPGGRLGVIAFHALEDTAVKRLLSNLARVCVCPPLQPLCTCAHRATLSLPTRRATMPSVAERTRNPRARSARLRVAVRLDADPPAV